MPFTADQLTELTDTPEDAALVAALLNGDADPEDQESVQDWERQCYSWPPRHAEMVMHAVDALTNGHGVEAIRKDTYVDRYHGDIVATYVNTGHSDALTIIHESRTGKFVLCSEGDWRS